MSKVKSYFQESYEELVQKTSWPTWSDLQKTSVLVAVSSVIISLVIAAMDKSISAILKTIYEAF
ncbi:preprotein translocase subunit SecE [Croceimicrobium hydrocarbonivorans]|uniref:Preprotein translocase subunit SecE n=1 Tax=Croceimicrobium hydrocarbonivorans TaxID=2761580 RepID=A0A7H0VGI6_9FLAO|nr:preprotein translocase subunit SecE [Croceimicrobium hydrocarbonivorans]QNR24834.1 preprotein translocase subunit SecE [Croceimicrobium hydrocarbonivorans]